MYAVIKTGGKQYRVSVGQKIKLEKLDTEEGKKVSFSEVLMVGNGDEIKLGAPLLKSAKVTAKVLEHGRGKKIDILKFKCRKHHMKRRGHRQDFTQVQIEDIKS